MRLTDGGGGDDGDDYANLAAKIAALFSSFSCLCDCDDKGPSANRHRCLSVKDPPIRPPTDCRLQSGFNRYLCRDDDNGAREQICQCSRAYY